MLDIRVIREQTDKVKAALSRRGKSYDAEVDQAVSLDERRRALIAESETLKAEQNKMSKRVPEMKKNGEDATAAMAEMKLLSARTKELNGELSQIEDDFCLLLFGILCMPDASVPTGADSAEDQPVRT